MSMSLVYIFWAVITIIGLVVIAISWVILIRIGIQLLLPITIERLKTKGHEYLFAFMVAIADLYITMITVAIVRDCIKSFIL